METVILTFYYDKSNEYIFWTILKNCVNISTSQCLISTNELYILRCPLETFKHCRK
jgi:hypothetical protein